MGSMVVRLKLAWFIYIYTSRWIVCDQLELKPRRVRFEGVGFEPMELELHECRFSANGNISREFVQWLANLETGLCFFASFTAANL